MEQELLNKIFSKVLEIDEIKAKVSKIDSIESDIKEMKKDIKDMKKDISTLNKTTSDMEYILGTVFKSTVKLEKISNLHSRQIKKLQEA